MEAHKVILASSSPFFLNLLKENQNAHPIIFMIGLKSETVLAMVDFLYHGETNVDEEEVKTFLAAAEELKVKGLANLDTKVNSKPNSNDKKYNRKYSREEILLNDDIKTDDNIDEDISNQNNKLRRLRKEELPTAVPPTITEKDINIRTTSIHKKVLSCDTCKKIFKRKKCLEKHVLNHSKIPDKDETFTCNLCNSSFSTRRYFKKHVQRHCKERSLKDLHQCPECSTQVKNLSKHMLRIHSSEKRFPCSQCDKGFIEGDKLRDHIRSVHDKEKPYECRYDCGVRVSSPAYRRKHEKQKHGQAWEGVEREGGVLGTANTFF